MRHLGIDLRDNGVEMSAHEAASHGDRARRQCRDLLRRLERALVDRGRITTVLTMPAAFASAASSGRPMTSIEKARA
jgi:hypothetical protein